jgi:hypothetical protein
MRPVIESLVLQALAHQILDAGPAWAGAINTVLVTKGVRVSELRRAHKDVSLVGEAARPL